MNGAAPLPPLALYVHLPWCVRKCPYCDFNSHVLRGELPVAAYARTLEADLDALGPLLGARSAISVYLGGGTPSLFPPEAMGRLLEAVRARVPLAEDAEVTLEANPGTVDPARLAGYRAAGVTRLSLGVQSFDARMLAALGRVHDAGQARCAAEWARAVFDEVNLDLMYGLPGQTLEMVRADLAAALRYEPTHVSAYQLAIEPNTVFWSRPPPLPEPDLCADMQFEIEALLAAAGYEHYEVSAFARPGHRSRHNLNYWQFGDYAGLGAGAHGKLTVAGTVTRHERPRAPREHARAAGRVVHRPVPPRDLPFEFALNALRLVEGFDAGLFCARTGLPWQAFAAPLAEAERRGLVELVDGRVRPSALGRRFLNDAIALFLPAAENEVSHLVA